MTEEDGCLRSNRKEELSFLCRFVLFRPSGDQMVSTHPGKDDLKGLSSPIIMSPRNALTDTSRSNVLQIHSLGMGTPVRTLMEDCFASHIGRMTSRIDKF